MKKILLEPFEGKVYLSSPTMHGEELKYMKEAYDTNWMSTIGANINELEKIAAERIGVKYAIALSCGTAALHLAMKLAGITKGTKVFCTDMTFDATVNPIVYEGGIPIFIDSEYETWNMDPKCLEKAFSLYPDVKHIVVANLYGTPSKLDEIVSIAQKHNAIVIEDAAESFGATYKGKETGSFGDIGVISFNGNKIITGSSGGMLLTNSEEEAFKTRKWSTQSRESAPWYQHEELGYNYRMSNVIAGVARGQFPYLDTHIVQKKNIYFRYKEGLKNLPISLNPYLEDTMVPNYWLSCMLIDKEFMCKQERTDKEYSYISENNKSCPQEILDAIASINAEGRPIWKPMHMQPIYKDNDFVCIDKDNVVNEDIFNRGVCLPSDNKMTIGQQNKIIETIKACFN